MSRDTRNILIGAVLLALLVVASYATVPGPGGDVQAGDVAPDFTLPDRSGKDWTLSTLQGRIVMVNFWATWCPPCVEEWPSMQKLYEQVGGPDFEIVAISLDKLGDKVLDEFLGRGRFTIPVVLDPGNKIAAQYGTFRFPETYVLDRQGVVVHKFTGAVDWADPAAVQWFRDLIAGKAGPEASASAPREM
ncbi:MAG: TlpA family protein disulfide reductase [Candidatus Methylomirabilis sp.]|nr:TlpA family protein disulfide reductase [Deltaproteobacteria bacterium]